MGDKVSDKSISSLKAKYSWLVIVRVGKEINKPKEIIQILNEVLDSVSKNLPDKRGTHSIGQFNDSFQNSYCLDLNEINTEYSQPSLYRHTIQRHNLL